MTLRAARKLIPFLVVSKVGMYSKEDEQYKVFGYTIYKLDQGQKTQPCNIGKEWRLFANKSFVTLEEAILAAHDYSKKFANFKDSF